MNLIEKYETLSEEKKKIVLERIQSSGADYGIYPLSRQQQGAWWSYCLEGEGENSYYNIEFCIKMEGPIEPDACREAVRKTLAGQEACFYKFAELEGEVYQYKQMDGEIAFQYVSAEGEKDLEALEAKKDRFVREPFNLKKQFPIRFLLARKSKTEAELLVSIHHIICDGWSVGVFFKKFFYYLKNTSKEAEICVPYSDYILEESSEDSQRRYKENLDYWSERLAETDDFLDLPLVYAREEQRSRRADTVSLSLSQDLSDRVHKAVKERRATLHGFLLAVYSILVWRYANKKNFLIGTPLAKRENLKYKDTIGDFATTIALPLEVDQEHSFEEHLRRTQKELFDGVEHQDITLSDLYLAAGVQRKEGVNPLFQISFAVQSKQLLGAAAEERFSIDETQFLVSSIAQREQNDFQLDFCFTVYDSPQQIQIEILYGNALFHKERIQTLLRVYQFLLEQVLDDFHIFVKELRLCEEDAPVQEGALAAVDEKNRMLPPGFEGPLKRVGKAGLTETGTYGCRMEDGTIRVNEEKSDIVTIEGKEVSLSQLERIIRNAFPDAQAECRLVKGQGLKDNVYIVQYEAGQDIYAAQLPEELEVKPLVLLAKEEWKDNQWKKQVLKAAEIRGKLADLEDVVQVLVQKSEDGAGLKVLFQTRTGKPLADNQIQKIRKSVKDETVPIGFMKEPSWQDAAQFYSAKSRSQAEDRIFQIWKEILENDHFTIYDKFYEVGGNSMKAVKLFQALQKEFNGELNIAQLFSCNTIQEQAQYFTKGPEHGEAEQTEGVGF